MSKKITALVLFAIFLLSLSSCTMAGAELGLMGKWKGSYGYTNTFTPPEGQPVTITSQVTQEWEIKNDDTYTLINTVSSSASDGMKHSKTTEFTGTIVKAEIKDKKLTFKDDKSGDEMFMYYTLKGDKLTLRRGDVKIELTRQ